MRMIAASASASTSSVSVFIVLCLIVANLGDVYAHARKWHMDVRSPCDIMVDVVNHIGLNILKVHNSNNDNNIALSPYGTVSILTALLEGVRGTAEDEIQMCGGFPANRDIVRIGLRDIHRLLRTYFIPREGFLSGLSLSSERVILKPEYLSILRFYGYDMTSFNTPIYPDLETTTPMNSETEYTTTEPPLTTITTLTTEPPLTTTEPPLMTTKPPLTTTLTTGKREEDDVTTTKIPETTLPETTISITTPETTLPESTLPPTTTLPETTTQTTIITTNKPETTTQLTTITTNKPETTTTEIPTTTYVPVTTPILTTLQPKSKRSIVHYLIPQHHEVYSDLPRYNSIEQTNAFLVNGKFPETHVRFMTYETILPFYYIPNLNALALRFPLDSPKYYLLLVLPVDNDGIERIICDIGNAITLKQIISHLHPTFVRAVIPSFTLRGLVTLTSSLQKLGIKEIFEPYRADFSGLTNDTNVYVTNIEQAITVIIKNYMEMDPTLMSHINNRNLYHEEPVEFKATHPFLYFVMDAELDVALIAGKIVNPINSRIQ